MTQIQEKVTTFINKNIEIQRAIENDIISIRKLSRFIANNLEIKSKNIDATISAVRRYKLNLDKLNKKKTKTSGTQQSTITNLYKIAHKTLQETKIITKSDIITIVIEKDNDAHKILPKLFDKINYNKGEVLRIMQAETSIKIVIDKRNFDKVKKFIPDNKIIKIEKELAEINLLLHKDAVKTPGILTGIFSELTINNVNIMEAVSCVPEMLLFVKEKDLLDAYSVLFKLIKG